MNLGHAIQVIDQNDPVPPRILPPSPSTVPVVMSTVDTSTVVTSRVVVPVQTQSDGTSPLKLSGFIECITILALALFAALIF